MAARRKQTSRYCTNRPNIKVPFRLPDWLLRKKLPPPGSREFELMIDKLIGQLRAQGVDTKGLERFQEFLERKCSQLEGPRDLPGWLESVGLSRGEKVDRDARDAWRQQMLDKTRAWWLRLLASGDPDLIAAGLRARMAGFRKFDEGLQGNAQAAIDMIEARQTLIEDLAEGLPVAGEAMDLYAVVTGRRILNGKEISTLERMIRAGGILAPKALEQLFKRSKLAQRGAAHVAEKLSVMGKWGKNSLSKITKIPVGQIDNFLAKTQKVLTTEISLDKWRMGRQAQAAGDAFSKTAAGAADLGRHAEELDQMVTSRWHPEAYNSGEVGFSDFLGNGKTPTVSRLDDIRDTIAIKSEHWWHMAAREADPSRQAQQVAEGMRQATKQWDRIIEPRVGQYMRNSKLASQLKVPTDLQVGLDVFRKVETGAITSRQADEMLGAIGLSKEGVLKKMNGFFEGMEKNVGQQFRSIGAAQLDDILRRNPHVTGSTEWGAEALGQINDALKTGNISGDVFMRQRTNVLSQLQQKVTADPTAAAFSALDSWVTRALTNRQISRLEARALREWITANQQN